MPFFYTLICLLALPVFGADKESFVGSGKVNILTYGSPSWNMDSRKIDEAFLILRDRNTGKLVKIQLEETEPDSSKFSGSFTVNLGEKIAPEIFIPYKELRGQDKISQRQLYEMIQKGKLQRKPMIWTKNAKGQSVMDVYDTREQAEAALRAYESEQAAARNLSRKKPKGVTKEQAVGAAQEAERKAQMDKLAMEAAKRTADRVRMEQIERQKAVEREEEMKALSAKERGERRRQAANIAAEAGKLYDAGDFKGAEDKFRQAIDLDPEHREYHYKYGVTLYRNEKFNEALVALKIAKVARKVEMERDYFMGLVHFRLSELDNALAKFNSVSKSSDPNLGPSATFYAGVVYFAQEKYEQSKKCFEQVIDTSTDPKMDAQAEEYIDKIAAAEAFKKMRENKFTFMAVVGGMYDSNVLLSPDNSTSTATDSSDFRLMTIFDLQYRPWFTEKNELSPHVTVNLTNSLEDESAKADPFIYTLAAPYSRSGRLGSTGVKATVTPGYELLFMDPYETGTKQREQVSKYVTLDGTFILGKSWISGLSLDYRMDDSLDVASNGDDNMDATKYTLRTTQTLILDKKRIFMPSIAYVKNGADGKNKIYTRYDLGANYVAPFWWEMSANAGITVYQMKYDDATIPRTDKNITVSAGVSKPVLDWLTWGLTGTYTKNSSNVEANAYTKYMILTTATIVTNF